MDPSVPYDARAQAYAERLQGAIFQPVAFDLVSSLAPGPRSTLLDVGTGTGAALDALAKRVGAHGQVLGADLSRGMLEHAPQHGPIHLIQARLPELPFPPGAFGGIVASFVLSHLDPLRPCLQELGRLLAPHGALAASAWNPQPSPVQELVAGVLAEHVDLDAAKERSSHLFPNEAALADPAKMRDALSHAGFDDVKVTTRAYPLETTPIELLRMMDAQQLPWAIRGDIGDAAWSAATAELGAALEDRFGGSLTLDRQANLALARW